VENSPNVKKQFGEALLVLSSFFLYSKEEETSFGE
jgi:hypothetical protein